MTKRISAVLLALCLVGCTGMEVAVAFGVGGGIAGAIVKGLEGAPPVQPDTQPPRPAATIPQGSAPTVAAVVVDSIPDVVGVLGRIAGRMGGLPGGQVLTGLGGFLSLAAWLFSRRRST